MTPRGIRLNNPGNIRRNDPWLGMTREQPDPDFVRFETPADGIRAMARILMRYQHAYKLRTIRDWIARWAPPSENDTLAYIASVEQQTGINADAVLDILNPMTAGAIVRAIIRHENGQQPYTDEQIVAGLKLAGIA